MAKLAPEKRLARNLTAARTATGKSYRALEDDVRSIVGEDEEVSYEQIRKLHHGVIPWRVIKRNNRQVVAALARVYGVSLRDLSPELAGSTPPGTRTQNLQIVAA